MKTGVKCTVKWHYGHTDTEAIMTVGEIKADNSCKSGISVFINELAYSVDSELVVVESSEPSTLPKAEKKETFTRAEVRALLKLQRAKSVNSYGMMPVPVPLFRHPDYEASMNAVFKRLQNVSLVKF